MEKLTRDLEQMQAPFHHEADGEGEKIGPKADSGRQISKRHRRGLVLKDKIQIHPFKLKAFYSMAPLLFSIPIHYYAPQIHLSSQKYQFSIIQS